MIRFFLNNVEICSGAVSAMFLLVGRLVFDAPLWICFVGAGILFAGLYLVGSYWVEIQIERESLRMTLQRMQEKIQAGRQRLKDIRGFAGGIANQNIQKQLYRICTTGEYIFKNIEDNPSGLSKSSRFLLYLDRFLPIVERYARTSSDTIGQKLLQESATESEFLDLLDAVEQGFEKGYKNYLEHDVVEMRTVGRVLKKMMNVAEIGK